jgi:hypothetical protein
MVISSNSKVVSALGSVASSFWSAARACGGVGGGIGSVGAPRGNVSRSAGRGAVVQSGAGRSQDADVADGWGGVSCEARRVGVECEAVFGDASPNFCATDAEKLTARSRRVRFV